MARRRDGEGEDQEFARLAALTTRLASTANLDEICEAVLEQIVALGFGAVWVAVLDEHDQLVTIKEVIDDRDTTPEMPRIFRADLRQPIGRGFLERRMINIAEPESLLILEDHGADLPEDAMALPRVIYDHLRDNPFACGPILGSRGQPVGALGVSSYRGHQPIPDSVLESPVLRAFRDHLGIAMERAAFVERLRRTNAELVAAQERLLSDARMKAVGELATAVAHDLNNLAGVALMAVSVGKRSPGAASEVLPRIERANRAIGELVERLQRVARDNAPVDPAPVDLRQLVEDVMFMLTGVLREAGVEVALELGREPVMVDGDAVVLRQAIVNLVINARDAMASVQGQRRLRIAVTCQGRRVTLRVEDTGPGISAEIMDRLFEPFVTTRGSGHAGLGLATVRSAVDHFGGGVTAHNGPDGAVFELTLTRSRNRPAAAEPTPPPGPAPSFARRKVLAVDDDADVIFLLEAYLSDLGCDVVTCEDPLQAVELVCRDGFDVVLCDVGMPGKSGLEICAELRERGVNAKLVLITGWDRHLVRGDERFEVCDAIVQKPFVGPDLEQVFRELGL